MQNEDFDAVVIAFGAAVGQGAGKALSRSGAAYLSSRYIDLGRKNADAIDADVHAKCCRFFRALGHAAALKAEASSSEEITEELLAVAAEDLAALGLDCPLCPVG